MVIVFHPIMHLRLQSTSQNPVLMKDGGALGICRRSTVKGLGSVHLIRGSSAGFLTHSTRRTLGGSILSLALEPNKQQPKETSTSKFKNHMRSSGCANNPATAHSDAPALTKGKITKLLLLLTIICSCRVLCISSSLRRLFSSN